MLFCYDRLCHEFDIFARNIVFDKQETTYNKTMLRQ